MLEKTTSIFPNRAIEEFVEDIKSITQEIQELYCLDSIPWIIGVSWGKDSTAVLQLVWNAIASLPEEKRQKKVYVITTDTLVENPIVTAWVNKSISQLKWEIVRDWCLKKSKSSSTPRIIIFKNMFCSLPELRKRERRRDRNVIILNFLFHFFQFQLSLMLFFHLNRFVSETMT